MEYWPVILGKFAGVVTWHPVNGTGSVRRGLGPRVQMADQSDLRTKYDEFLRRAEEADRHAAGTADALMRVQWQNIAVAYRALAKDISGGF